MSTALPVTVTAPETAAKPLDIIEKYGGDYYCLQLLRFFGTYPFARFSELAVFHALDDNGERGRIRSALGRLVVDRMVIVCIENCTHLYRLAEDAPVRDCATGLAGMDWRQWHAVLSRAKLA